jgi:hypothetical protein
VVSQRDPQGGEERPQRKWQRRRRLRPPWGNILGGEPIEREGWLFNERIDLGDEFVREQQHVKMLRLLSHYRIVGNHDYPVQGVDTKGLTWYQLALAIATDLDDSLKVVDAPPPSKTAARWRGPEGLFLVRLVNAIRESRPKKSIRWCLNELRKRSSGLAKMPLSQLEVRYHEAKKHFAATERARKQKRPS